MIKILNLYAGIGGNRKLWSGDIKVTAVELNPEIAQIYQDFFPEDEVIVADAHQYLLDHFEEYDFIWASPPCPTHSRVRKVTTHQNKPVYPDMKLYEEILLLQGYFKGIWVIENVISWYDPLIKPYIFREHYYWSSFVIDGKQRTNRCHNGSIDEKQALKGFDLSKYNLKTVRKDQVLRNCVEPEAGLAIFNMAFKTKQQTLL